jgi:hypothetical protein
MSRSSPSTAKRLWIVLVLTATLIGAGQPLKGPAHAAPCTISDDEGSSSLVDESLAKPAPGVRPIIRGLCARLYGGYLVVTGTVRNTVGDPVEWTVTLSGSIVGTASVRSDGSFEYVTIYNYSYGEICAQALGPNGQVSSPAVTEVYE